MGFNSGLKGLSKLMGFERKVLRTFGPTKKKEMVHGESKQTMN